MLSISPEGVMESIQGFSPLLILIFMNGLAVNSEIKGRPCPPGLGYLVEKRLDLELQIVLCGTGRFLLLQELLV